jgi:hypothetical protein
MPPSCTHFFEVSSKTESGIYSNQVSKKGVGYISAAKPETYTPCSICMQAWPLTFEHFYTLSYIYINLHFVRVYSEVIRPFGQEWPKSFSSLLASVSRVPLTEAIYINSKFVSLMQPGNLISYYPNVGIKPWIHVGQEGHSAAGQEWPFLFGCFD